MRKTRILSLLLALVMTLGAIPFAATAASSFSAVGGWQESLYAEISGIKDSDVTAVSYSGTMSGSLTGQDLTYLVRDIQGGVRIDIPGLKPGTYTLTVTAAGNTYTQSDIKVTAYDRSGYAHWNYTQGVGAYKDDGTIKDNAVILYVTEANKNSVSLTAGGLTVSGIGNILNTGGKSPKNGSLANTNGDILKKLADENRPLVVRIVGRVTQPAGVTAWGSYDYGGNPDDNGGMCYMKTCKNITVEGIGNDAMVDGWGFAVGCSDGDYAKGYNRNFEFRNITFKNVPEDCIGISGRGGSSLTDPIEHAWVHNCAFYGPSGLPDASDDQDKAEGDGAVDFKWGQYYTMSYCYFEKYHKTHLIGGDDNNLQYNVTWHHNYYKDCESRGPLGRQANMHVYNNVYEGQSSYVMSMRANCYIFSEYNSFTDCKKVSNNGGGGVCKSYMNSFQNCTGTSASDLKIVTDKSQKVTSNNKYAGFELDAKLGYVAEGDYLLDADAGVAKEKAISGAGPMDFRKLYGSSSGGSQGGNQGGNGGSGDSGDSGQGGTQDPVINASSYIHNFTENALNSSFYTFTSCNLSAKGDVSFNGLTLSKCLKLESATNVSFNAPTDGTLTLVFHETGLDGVAANQQTVSIDGKQVNVAENNILVAELKAGSHTIKRGSKQIFLYYMVWTPKAQEIPEIVIHKGNGDAITSVDVTPKATTEKLAIGEALPYTTNKNSAPPIQITLEKGKQLTLDIPVTTPAWGNVAMVVNGDGTYTVIPETMRTETGVKLVIEESCKIIVVDNSKIFPDVSETHWARKQADYLSARGLMNGNLDGTFGQADTIQRRTVAMMLWRLAGQPDPKGSSPFSDFTNSGDRYYKAVVWAYEQGIINGYTDGTFRPTVTISRQHFAAMLHRYNTYTGAVLSSKDNGKLTDFSDYADMNPRMHGDMQWALDCGLINGRSGGIYDPIGGTSRSQMAVILCRYLENYYSCIYS